MLTWFDGVRPACRRAFGASNSLALLGRWGPVVLWLCWLYVASGEMLSSERTSRLLVPLIKFFFPAIPLETLRMIHWLIRKAAHLVDYAVLAWLLWRACCRSTTQRLVMRALSIFATCAFFGFLEEVRQGFVPGRISSLTDVFIDIVGAALALLTLVLRQLPRNQAAT